MSTLTRRDRVAIGAAQGGALYYGANRRWPEPGPGVFELFATHPGSTQRPPTDEYAHWIRGFTVSDLDGTPKLYTGYGYAAINKAPIHIWPLNLDGTWDPAPAHTMQTFGMRNYLHAEGSLWCCGDQGPSSFCSGSPGGVWVDGECHPHTGNDGGMTHPHRIARHDGYTWVGGQWSIYGSSGAVWRGTDPTGSDGEFVLGTPLNMTMQSPNNLFSYQGKLWMQPTPDYPGVPAYEGGRLCYWDEAAFTFLPTDISLPPAGGGLAGITSLPWNDLMLVTGSKTLEAFNGTTATTVYTSAWNGEFAPSIMDIHVTPDDTVWVLDADGVFYSSTDLETWTKRFRTDLDQGGTFTVHEDYVYIGDKSDHIWRARLTV